MNMANFANDVLHSMARGQLTDAADECDRSLLAALDSCARAGAKPEALAELAEGLGLAAEWKQHQEPR